MQLGLVNVIIMQIMLCFLQQSNRFFDVCSKQIFSVSLNMKIDSVVQILMIILNFLAGLLSNTQQKRFIAKCSDHLKYFIILVYSIRLTWNRVGVYVNSIVHNKVNFDSDGIIKEIKSMLFSGDELKTID